MISSCKSSLSFILTELIVANVGALGQDLVGQLTSVIGVFFIIVSLMCVILKP